MKNELGRLLLSSLLFWGSMFPAAAETRIFHDQDGRKIEAELVSVKADDVTIRKGSHELTLPITRFSEADRKFIREWAESEKNIRGNAPEPGETLTFDFPDLVKDFNGNPAAFKVKIPSSYDPTKPIGLLIFLDGANGHNGPEGALGLSKNDLVCAGLPYPDNGRNANQSNMVGSFDEVWDYWKPMLAKLEEAVPNLDPDLRIIGGFSNGAHAVDGLLGNPEFVKTFSAFYLIDGGGVLGGVYSKANDKHAYIAYGESSPNKRNSERVVRRAEQAGMKVVSHMMAETGHAFPGSERERVKTWIYETVVPDFQSDD